LSRDLKDRTQSPAAIVTAGQHRLCTFYNLPQQVECLARIGRSDEVEDGAPLPVQLSHERLDLLPINKALRPGNARQPLADFACRLRGSHVSGQGQPQVTLGSGIARAEDVVARTRSVGAGDRLG
jgi:hypothetical protein